MSVRSSSWLFTLLVSLGVGFGAGWWARGLDAGAGEASSLAAAGPEATAPFRSGQAGPAGRDAAFVDREAASKNASSAEARPSGHAPSASPQASDGGQLSAKQQFVILLGERKFDAAMDLYDRVERRGDASDLAELKGVALNQLNTYLNTGDNLSLTGLVDAFLARYYDDIDVLLILARHHQQSNYVNEAARAYQLAFTYAFSAADQKQVAGAFANFVQEVDQQLAGRGDWQELIGFYETLELIDLAQPRYQLRLAQLYLAQDEVESGRRLLTRLQSEPSVAAQAEALLRGMGREMEPVVQAPRGEAIALGRAGNHYHLPLRVNDEQDVRLLIDTGASTTILTQSAFDSMNHLGRLSEIGPHVFNTASGVAKGTVYLAERVQLGSHVLSDVHIAVLDFDMPEGIHGLLGMNVLSKFRFEVEQDEQRLYLKPR